ncbi:MAG: PAS domain-containing protein [Muribaculaceae bacterium]|nr:PAS domain-containing protein [Muribaculaceae bacterium]
MTGRIIFILLTCSVTAWGCLSLFVEDWNRWYNAAFLATTLFLIYCLYRSISLPLSKVIDGLDLLKSQDTANRLRKVGQHDADSIVSLFNSLMDSLRREKLKVQEQDHLIDMLIHTSSIGVAIFDYDRHISLTNDKMAELLGADNADSLIGKTLDQFPSTLASRLHELTPGMSKIMRIDGTSIFKCSCSSFLRNGFPIWFIIVEMLTDEIIRTEKSAYGRVIRTMAHEVNNTISGLVTLLDIINAVHPNDSEINEVSESAIQRCGSLTEFVKSYSDVMKIPLPVKVPTDINDMITSMIPFLESIVRGRGIIHIELATQPVTACIDKVLIEQVIVNIVKNSAESIESLNDSKTNGIITITTINHPTRIIITDNGHGIPQSVADNIFTPFFTTKRNGHGLGLMFVNETLRNHNCDFKLLTSASTGITSFSITFPDQNC